MRRVLARYRRGEPACGRDRSAQRLVALALFMALAPRAEAQVMALRVEAPGLPDSLAKALDKAVRDEISSIVAPKQKLLPAPALDFEGLRSAFGCPADPNACLQAIAKTVGAARVARVVIAGDSSAAKVTVTLTDTQGKTESVSGELSDLVLESAGDIRPIVALAFGVHRDSPTGQLQLYIASDVGRLEGAELLLDEKPVTAAELATVPSGKHRLEVKQKGFEPFIWIGAVRSGQETRVGVGFVPNKNVEPLPQPVAVLTKPSPKPSPSAAPAVTETSAVAPAKGPNYLVPAILGAVSIGAGVFATIQGVRVKGFESDDASKCDQNPALCVPDACAAFPEDCSSARSAATMATVGWVSAGVLAGGAIVAYLIESLGSSSGDGSVNAKPSAKGVVLEF